MTEFQLNLLKDVKYIAFDADDTLWENESHFREVEQLFCEAFKAYASKDKLMDVLIGTEVRNIERYGYGSKSFTISMMEAALELTKMQISPIEMQRILEIGNSLLEYPVVLFEGVEEVLQKLSQDYTLILATKGDLKEQQTKLDRSGLSKYFAHIEIMIEKDVPTYSQLLNLLKVPHSHFMMIGNSPKSDIFPIIKLGSNAVHIPAQTTWTHEQVDEPIESPRLFQLNSIKALPELLGY